MSDQTNLSDARQVLRDELVKLEAKALKGRRRATAIEEANNLLDQAEQERPLTPGMVSKWFRQGDPATDFMLLWALVQVLQEWSGATPAGRLIPPYRGPGAGNWQATEDLWKKRWEQAKLTPPRRTGLDEAVRRYLEAARKAAEQHPYPGIPDQMGPPSLAEVYVRQRSRSTGRDTRAEPRDDSTAATAEAIFRRADRLSVLIASAGAGKSTLLRTRLREAADDCLNAAQTTPSAAVPIWVSARALTGEETQIPDALAAATRQLSRYGRHPELSKTRFLQRPCTGAYWQLLVDGLDELPNAHERRAVLQKLVNAVTHDPPLYRCVVATRPLTENELNVLGDTAPRYELQPFTPDDLHTYVDKYFSTRWPQQEAARRAQQFTGALRDTSLTELARTPLMAFMLCQLYLAQPERPLPDGRTAVYSEFTDLLYENNQHKQVADSHKQAIERLVNSLQSEQAREDVAVAARQVHKRLPELINYLACQWRTGQQTPVAETLASHEAVNRPNKVRLEQWSAFLEDLLQHTGLLVRHSDGLGFPHQTFLEFHAARHATRDKQARIKLLDELFTPGEGTPWVVQTNESSYIGFLLDGLLCSSDSIAAETAIRIETRIHSTHVFFFVTQLALRTKLPTALTARRLNHFAQSRDHYSALPAAGALARMEGYREHAAQLLAQFADDETALSVYGRAQAASYLAKVEGYRDAGANRLIAVAEDTALNSYDRRDSAIILAYVEGYRERAAQLLTQFADDTTLNDSDRRYSAEALAGVEGHRGAAANRLIAFADDTTLARSDRASAAWTLAMVLAGLEGYLPRSEDSMRGFLFPDENCEARKRATEALPDMEGYRERAAQLLTQFADDTTLNDSDRRYSAEALAYVEGYRERATQLLTRFADDTTFSESNRWHATRVLALIRRWRESGLTSS